MTSNEIKDALRSRHPGRKEGVFVGRWTCIEELLGIDLLALDAWADAAVVGYEIKVSRSDMRNELLRPWKRQRAVEQTTRFFFAVPVGLLTEDELSYKEPEWEPDDFKRVLCPMGCRPKTNPKAKLSYSPDDKRHHKGMLRVPLPLVLGSRYDDHRAWDWVPCPRCNKKGYIDVSRVEREAPKLWVPRDCGLIEIDGRGCHVIRQAPKRKTPKLLLDFDPKWLELLDEEHTNRVQRQTINGLVRWVSNRPDPRHAQT